MLLALSCFCFGVCLRDHVNPSLIQTPCFACLVSEFVPKVEMNERVCFCFSKLTQNKLRRDLFEISYPITFFLPFSDTLLLRNHKINAPRWHKNSQQNNVSRSKIPEKWSSFFHSQKVVNIQQCKKSFLFHLQFWCMERMLCYIASWPSL